MRGTKTPCVKPVCISDFTKTGEQTRKKCTAVQSGSGQTCWFAYFLVVLNVICSPSWKRFDQSTQDKSTQQGDRNRHATTSASNHWHLALDCKPDLRFLCGSISDIPWYLTVMTLLSPFPETLAYLHLHQFSTPNFQWPETGTNTPPQRTTQSQDTTNHIDWMNHVWIGHKKFAFEFKPDLWFLRCSISRHTVVNYRIDTLYLDFIYS